VTPRRGLAAPALPLLLPAASPARADLREDLHQQDLGVMAGPSPWGWNLVGVKKDLHREPRTTLFATAGLGPIVVGVGAARHPEGRQQPAPSSPPPWGCGARTWAPATSGC